MHRSYPEFPQLSGLLGTGRCATTQQSARAGEPAPLAYSLQYAAPEVIAAADRGEHGVIASAAVDVWALGVIAFELLTSTRAFAPSGGRIHARLLGTLPLAWEDEAVAGPLLAKLKGLRRSVLQCLARDPAARPTTREVLGAWNGLFESVSGSTRSQYCAAL